MATKTTGSFFSKTNDVGTTHSTPSWMSCPISTIENAIKSALPESDSHKKITGIKLHITADFDCGMGLANVYLQYGFGDGSSISQHLLGDTKFTKTTPLEYPSGGVDIKSYISSFYPPYAIKRTYGDYLTFRFYSENRFSKKYYINSATLEITYDEFYKYKVVAEPTEGGSVYDYGGVIVKNYRGQVEAVPNKGYRFIGWYRNGTLESTELIYEPYIPANNVVYTAKFEKIPPPKFTSAEMIYGGKQISPENKVIAGQSFIISVAVT